MPSSRSGSCPATAMYAGANPAKSVARAGTRVAGGFLRSWPWAYHRENSPTASRARIGAFAFSVNDGSEVSHVVPQQLEGDRRAARVTRQLCHDGCEVAACRV